MDILFLREVRAETLVGIYQWERQTRQTVEIDLEIGIPHDAPCHTDNIEDTIHYAKVVETVREAVAKQHFLLLEALAEYIANVVRNDFTVPWVRVTVAKPGILRGVKRVGVTIERGSRPPSPAHC